MTYNVFGGTLSLTQSINQSVLSLLCSKVWKNALPYVLREFLLLLRFNFSRYPETCASYLQFC